MSIRTYRRPIPVTQHYAGQPNSAPPPPGEYEEIFVLLESPLLEFTKADLAFLRERGIDPFSEVEGGR